ncbi:hypothetical protein [Mammaliicoccus sciuri]|uniref:hypothetical protein n=1 Tax=Mammaliicoccus sciuri TaxID=1296 RepID=UPI003F563F0E
MELLETMRISFNDEAVLDYCNIMGYQYYEEVPVQYLLSVLREFNSFKPFMRNDTKLKQIKSQFEQTERIMTLENYIAELECLNETKEGDNAFYQYQMTLFKNRKEVAKVTAEFSIMKL